MQGAGVNDETLALREHLFKVYLAPEHLGLREQTVLHLLFEHGSLTAAALARSLCAPDWRIAQVLEALARRGYVTHDHAEDPIRRRWSCTELGWGVVRRLLNDTVTGHQRYGQLLARLRPEEQVRAREHWGDLVRAYETLKAEQRQGRPQPRR